MYVHSMVEAKDRQSPMTEHPGPLQCTCIFVIVTMRFAMESSQDARSGCMQLSGTASLRKSVQTKANLIQPQTFFAQHGAGKVFWRQRPLKCFVSFLLAVLVRSFTQSMKKPLAQVRQAGVPWAGGASTSPKHCPHDACGHGELGLEKATNLGLLRILVG